MRDPIPQIMTTSLKASSHMTPHCPVMQPLILSHGSPDTKATLPLGTTWGPRMDINQYQTNKLLWLGLLISPYDGDLFAHTQWASQQTRPTSSLGHYSFHIPPQQLSWEVWEVQNCYSAVTTHKDLRNLFADNRVVETIASIITHKLYIHKLCAQRTLKVRSTVGAWSADWMSRRPGGLCRLAV